MSVTQARRPRCAGCAAPTPVALIARLEPDHPRMGRLLPGCGVQQAVFSCAGPLCVAAHLPGGRAESHPKKPRKWIASPLLRAGSTSTGDDQVGVRRTRIPARWPSAGDDIACLVKFSWTPIVRHTLVTGRASPDDPDLASYWAERRRKVKPALDSYNLRLLAKQDSRCPLCGDHLLTVDQPPQSPSEWERWWLGVVKRAIAADYLTHHGRAAWSDADSPGARLLPSQLPGWAAQEPNGFRSSRNVPGACLSRMPGRLARTVLAGGPPQQCGGPTRTGGHRPVVRTPLVSGYRGRPPRSYLVCVERGNPVGSGLRAGRPIVRGAESLGGNRMLKKRMPMAERQRDLWS